VIAINPETGRADLWTYTASPVLNGPRAQVEVILADLQRHHWAFPEVVKGPFQHRGSWDWEVRCRVTVVQRAAGCAQSRVS
jgi:hypothetical protein